MNGRELRRWVRSALTVMGFGALTYTFVVGRLPVEAYVPMVGMMIAWWFGEERDTNR